MRLSWAARSDIGKVRSLNEDSVVAEPGLFAVADGMGGHAAGDVASQLVAEHVRARRADVPLSLDALGELVTTANTAVRAEAARAGTHGMGTTLVAAMLVDNAGSESIVVVNVGDSRCYVHDENGLRAITRDHSVVQELIDARTISPEEARLHPSRNVVTRAIGADEHVAPDYVVLEPAARQRLLLCSDGVSGQLEPEDLDEILKECAAPDAAVEAIIDRVLEGRAPDNATAIVVDVEWSGLGASASEETGPRPDAADEITAPLPLRTAVAARPGSDQPIIDEVPS